jgi:protein FAM50
MSKTTEGMKKLQRNIQHEKFLIALQKPKEKASPMDEKFTAKQDHTDELINEETTGRQSLNDYRRKRARIESDMGLSLTEIEEKKKKKLKPVKTNKETKKLSFKFEDDDEEDDNESYEEKKEKIAPLIKTYKLKVGKDPSVDTSFLPDKERDEAIEKENEKLRLIWLDEQEKIKEELFTIDYCYYDGTSHKKSMTLKKGETIRTFLDEARLNFPELKGVSLNDLMFLKDNYNVPDNFTFYELFEIRAKDPTYETFSRWTDVEQLRTFQLGGQSTQLARIVERNFYEKNAQSFPFTNWVLFTEEGIKKIPIFSSNTTPKKYKSRKF